MGVTLFGLGITLFGSSKLQLPPFTRASVTGDSLRGVSLYLLIKLIYQVLTLLAYGHHALVLHYY